MLANRRGLCWPRTVAGRRLAEELARCDREIAEMYAQTGDPPAIVTTLGIEDWQAERRLIEAEILNGASEGKDTPMLVRMSWWESVRDRFDDDEKAALTCAVVAETISPTGVAIDPRRLPGELREKVEGLLYGERTQTATV